MIAVGPYPGMVSRGPISNAIGCLVEHWHDSEDPRPLHEFLGMTGHQFSRWSAELMSGEELQVWADGAAAILVGAGLPVDA
ncbi:hypothetical protein ACIGO9_30220 [Nocardia asteroides]|uniref:hypothetical protein n=1 Tax=Nocardia asteroides TaxID=1824 RepID=UPI0037C95178